MERFIPRGDRVLVRPASAPQRKPGTLATPQAQQSKATRGVVVAGGPQAIRGEVDTYEPEVGIKHISVNLAGVIVGEEVGWKEYAGEELKINGETFRLLALSEIKGTWEQVDG